MLERIVNATLTLALCNLAFSWMHCEKLGQVNSGNFLSIIELLSFYVPVLKELLERPSGSVNYLSPQIQNELIYILAERVKCDIQAEMQEAPFFSISMDTTPDVSKVDQ